MLTQNLQLNHNVYIYILDALSLVRCFAYKQTKKFFTHVICVYFAKLWRHITFFSTFFFVLPYIGLFGAQIWTFSCIFCSIFLPAKFFKFNREKFLQCVCLQSPFLSKPPNLFSDNCDSCFLSSKCYHVIHSFEAG